MFQVYKEGDKVCGKFTNETNRMVNAKVEAYVDGHYYEGDEEYGLMQYESAKVCVDASSLEEGEHKVTFKCYWQYYNETEWHSCGEKTVTIGGKKKKEKPKPKPSTCTIDDFVRSMVSNYHKNSKVVGWADNESPIVDVTDLIKRFDNSVEKATLTIYGSKKSEIKVKGPYKDKPPALTPYQIYQNWQKGEEWERQYCSKDKKWYWVIYPCKLNIERPEKPKPVPVVETKATIDRNNTYMEMNSHRFPPGTYEVQAGRQVSFYGVAKRTQGKGKIFIKLIDLTTNEALASSDGYEEAKTGGMFDVGDEVKVRFVAGHYEDGKEVIDDTYGDWIVKAKKEQPKPKPKPEECTLDYFATEFLNDVRRKPNFLGFLSANQPVLDVTNIVKEFDKDVVKARLIITVDTSKMYVEEQSSKPTLSDSQRYASWAQGTDLEVQYCPKNGKWYIVKYPCKLEVQKQEKPSPQPSPGKQAEVEGSKNAPWILLAIGVGIWVIVEALSRR